GRPATDGSSPPPVTTTTAPTARAITARTAKPIRTERLRGRFAGPADLDLPLDDARLREVGLTLGSGVVMVHDQHVDLVDQLRRIAAFFRDESCGQCVPCRVGTVRQEEAIERLASGTGEADLSLLRDIAGAMRDASICGLGQTAANAIQSAVVRLGVLT
ncbi:MAG: NADH-ubiquinone oxidoreductase-F iron-sulfur binding region domain-containing protein, partial [Ilumatobacteraceae bacterium]